MVNLKKQIKGQGLPLNTIVIAILVIIVLLVIIVFFTSKMGDSGQSLDQNNPTKCEMTNPAISTLGYTQIEKVETCSAEYTKIPVVPSWKADDGETTLICCGKK